jgi:hypothetical protein
VVLTNGWTMEGRMRSSVVGPNRQVKVEPFPMTHEPEAGVVVPT